MTPVISEFGARGDGIVINGGSGHVIGGMAAADGNLISGNNHGIWISGTSEVIVRRNFIGSDRTGMADITNLVGIALTEGASRNIIGGDRDTEGNLIVGSHGGTIDCGLDTTENKVWGNRIGVNADANAALGDPFVAINLAGDYNEVGAVDGGRGNILGGGRDGGILVGGAGDLIRGNFLGIDPWG